MTLRCKPALTLSLLLALCQARSVAGEKGVEIVKTFKGHTDLVYAVAFTRDGKYLATGSFDNTVKLWDVATGKEIATLGGPQGHQKMVLGVAVSPDGLVASGSADNTLKVWDALSLVPVPGVSSQEITSTLGQSILSLRRRSPFMLLPVGSLDRLLRARRLKSPTPVRNFPHPNHVDVVAFHPTAPILASGGHDGKLRFFDLVKGNQIREINAHPGKDATMIYALAFSPDGKQVVSGSYDHSLKLWDVNSGNLVKEFKAFKVRDFEKGHQDPVFSVAFSPDGKFIASGSGGLERVIKIWNVADGSVVRDLHNPAFKLVTAPPPEKAAAAGQAAVTGAAATITLGKAEPRLIAQSHPGWVYQLRFTSDGKYLVSAGDAPLNKGYLAVWNPGDGKMLYGESLPLGNFYSMAIAPDSKLVALGAGPRGRPGPEFNTAYLLKLAVLGK